MILMHLLYQFCNQVLSGFDFAVGEIDCYFAQFSDDGLVFGVVNTLNRLYDLKLLLQISIFWN